mmetsp:Transcript_72488/g.155242  ORF Transcript_72488/g.155242 Transcript_72488/m.155242 type:complete len:202 (-) Transcript_72488:97-702(-)
MCRSPLHNDLTVHQSSATGSLGALLILTVVVRGRLHLIDPVPLPAGDLHCHCAGHNLLSRIDGGECRDAEPQDDDRRDVEEEVLGLHEQPVVAPEDEPGAGPERHMLLREFVELRRRLRRVAGHDPSLATLLDQFRLRHVVHGVGVVVILGIFSLGPGAVRVQVRARVAARAEAPERNCWSKSLRRQQRRALSKARAASAP